METYPLESLLAVRHYREESAKRHVRSAEHALHEAEQDAARKEQELKQYRIWKQQEEDRRYEAIMNTAMTHEDLDGFKAGLAVLSAEEAQREHAVLQAAEEVKSCRSELDAARERAKKASRNTSKIQTHKDIWSEEAKKEAEHKEDLELEEFRPLSRKGAEAEGEDA